MHDQINAALLSRRGFFQRHLKILRSHIPMKSATEKLIINVIAGETRLNSVVEPRSGCLLVCIRTSDINKRLTIASPTSCPNTRFNYCTKLRVRARWVGAVGAGGNWSLSKQLITFFQSCRCERDMRRAGK